MSFLSVADKHTTGGAEPEGEKEGWSGMSERKSYPLSWPDGWKRAKVRVHAAFNKTREPQYNGQGQKMYQGKTRLSVADAVRRVLAELERMGIKDDDIIISTNVPLRLDGLPRSDQEPGDPGVAVYWKKKGQPSMRCMAIDRYYRVADNLAAVAATLDAMRAIERHGGAEILNRAFLGFAALPEQASQPWREVLGIEGVPSLELIESRFRALVKVHHPDTGGTPEDFMKLQQAREAARMEIAS
jgi:hypothetical protein